MEPLASKLRPASIKDIVGQKHLTDDGKILDIMIKNKKPINLILYGPPGIGKTSIAYALSNDLNIEYAYFNASTGSKKELTDIIKNHDSSNPILILLDEVHRLDKPKQDFLLQHMENGTVIMIGATTENPHINTTPALRSRSQIVELKPITTDDITEHLKHIRDTILKAEHITDENLEYIAQIASGDMRYAITQLDILASITTSKLNNDQVKELLGSTKQYADKDGDSHYDLLSAFQKSIRGSDADASLYYLARLIEAGDLQSINRRLLVIAYEDIGLADPMIGMQTLTVVNIAEKVGLPEARIPLSQIVIQLALSPKSNTAYKAIDSALTSIHKSNNKIPAHLQDTHYKGAESLNRGIGYKYPHDFPHGITTQQYLPDDLIDEHFLEFQQGNDTVYEKRYNNINKFIKINKR